MLARSYPLFTAAIMIAFALSAGSAQAQQADNIDWDNKRDAARAHSSAYFRDSGRVFH